MDHILGAISFFLSVPETEYALMINGPWGSGKTHFYKTKIQDLISSKNYIPCYVSLNGIKSTDEISRKMLLKANPNIMRVIPAQLKEAFCALYPAGKALGVLNEARLEIVPLNIKEMSNCVFVFDDFERVCIDFQELLGFFNNFVEHSKIKCIFITNEAEIISKYQEQNPEKKPVLSEESDTEKLFPVVLNEYLRIKEKIVGKTLNFCSEISITVKEMASEIVTDKIAYNAVIKEKGYLEELNSKHSLNLRALKGAFYSFNNLAKSFPIDDPGLKEKYLSRIFRLINAISAENSEGNYTLVDNLVALPNSFAFFSKVMVESNKDYQRFFSKYLISEENTVFSTHVLRYLTSGNLDLQGWKEEISPSRVTDRISDDPLEMFDSFAYFSDEELQKKVKLLFDKMNSGSIQFMFFPKIFQFLEFLIHTKAVTLDIETVIGIFLAALEKIKPEYYENASFNDPKFSFTYSDNASSDLKLVLDSVLRKKNELQKLQLQKKAKEFFEKYIEPENLTEELPLAYLEKMGLKQLPIFHRLNNPESLERIVNLSNHSLIRLINLIKQRYNFTNISSYFWEEAEFFAELNTALTKEIAKTRPSIRCHLLFTLQNRIETILHSLKR
ncbi:MAG: KAP family P-loop domain-containing protein [Candidatus Rifleibacteriota bacterium]